MRTIATGDTKPDFRQIVWYALKVGFLAGVIASACTGLYFGLLFLGSGGLFIVTAVSLIFGMLTGIAFGVVNGLLIACLTQQFFSPLTEANKYSWTIGVVCVLFSLSLGLGILMALHSLADFWPIAVPIITAAAWWASQKVCHWYLGVKQDKTTKQMGWFRFPLHQNPKAATPIFLASVGFLCLEAGAVWINPAEPLWNSVGLGFLTAGLVLTPVGFIEGIAYRCYRGVELALILPCAGPIWSWLLFSLYPASSYRAIIFFCLFLQLPLTFVVLCRLQWWQQLSPDLKGLTAIGLVCLFAIPILKTQREVAAAPHVSDEYLSSIYEKNDRSAIRKLTDKRIVVTGIVRSDTGDGPCDGGRSSMEMSGTCIDVNDLSLLDGIAEGENVSVFGKYKGREDYGEAKLTGCRTIGR